jgi:mutator protein MutT
MFGLCFLSFRGSTLRRLRRAHYGDGVYVEVGIGIIIDHGRVLICRRHDDPADAFGGYWEFPGGKCEPPESPVECVRREIREELGIEVTPVTALTVIEHRYPTVHVRLHPFVCRLDAGEPRAISAAQCKWVGSDELREYRFPEANAELLTELRRVLI